MDATALSALTMLLWVLAVGAAVAALLGWPAWQRWRRQRLAARPFPAAWRRILRQRVPAVARLPTDQQHRLKQLIQVFVAEKPFIGCAGQTITDEVRVTIAAQASLLLLGQAGSECYPGLRQVLVYPGAFAVDAVQPGGGGVVHEQRQALAGQSWAQGQVLLGWAEVLAGAANPADGQNVVIHEFAHQIDQDKGPADGRPWRPRRSDRQRWAQVMDAGLQRLREQPSALISAYGATDAAEYFAVVSELFFEQPRALADEAPEVYRELALLYRLHPLAW